MTASIKKSNPILLVQFNEANFELIEQYCKEFHLPGFGQILKWGLLDTESEKTYEKLEPWIQWYSFYCGKSLDEHGVFHLGDCLKNKHQSIFDILSDRGESVGIFGAMNHHPNPKFKIYIPDAWTEAESDGSVSSKLVSSAVRSLVNRNARLGIGVKELLGVLVLMGWPISVSWFRRIIGFSRDFIRRDRASLASSFDSLFAAYSLRRIKKDGISVSAVFLNGLAHVQHHYMLSSKFIEGPELASKGVSGPEDGTDHILVALKNYDRMFSLLIDECCKCDIDLWVATGLTQIPCPKPFVYWRFKNHQKTLQQLFPNMSRVLPRMTRDFEIEFSSCEAAEGAAIILSDATWQSRTGADGSAFGFIDVRGTRVFASFVYSEPNDDISIRAGQNQIDMLGHLDFVAWKNGVHSQSGWAGHNSCQAEEIRDVVNIKDLGRKIFALES